MKWSRETMKGAHMAEFGRVNKERKARGEKPLKRSEYFKKPIVEVKDGNDTITLEKEEVQ